MLMYHDALLVLPLVTAEIANATTLLSDLGDEKVSRNLTQDYLDRLNSIRETILKGP